MTFVSITLLFVLLGCIFVISHCCLDLRKSGGGHLDVGHHHCCELRFVDVADEVVNSVARWSSALEQVDAHLGSLSLLHRAWNELGAECVLLDGAVRGAHRQGADEAVFGDGVAGEHVEL